MANPLIRYRAHVTGLSGAPGLYTQYWDAGAAPGTPEGTEAGARVRAFWESIKGLLNNAVAIQYDTGGDLIDPVTGNLVGSVGGTTPASTAGTSASLALPWASQVLADMFTAGVVSGRRIKGRHYLPGFTTGALTAGAVSAGTQTSVNTASALLSTLITTAITPVVWHRPHDVHGNPGQAFTVVAYSCPGYFAVLRSRRD